MSNEPRKPMMIPLYVPVRHTIERVRCYIVILFAAGTSIGLTVQALHQGNWWPVFGSAPVFVVMLAMAMPMLRAKRVFGTKEALWVRNGHDEQTVPWSRVTGVDKVGFGVGAFLCHADVQGDDRGVSFVGSAALLEQFERFRRGEQALPGDHSDSRHPLARRVLYAERKHAGVRAAAATALTCSTLSLIVVALRGAPAYELLIPSIALLAQAFVFSNTVWATRRVWTAPEGLYASGTFSATERLYPWSDVGPCDSPAWAFIWPLTGIARIRLRNSRGTILFFAVPDARSAIEGGRAV